MLYTHQQSLLDLNPPKQLLAWGTGTGKTKAALALAIKNCKSILIVCPKGLKTNWMRELQSETTHEAINEKNKGKRFEDFSHRYTEGSVTFTIVSKEEFRRDWDKYKAYEGVIIDEAHTFAGMQSQMHRAMCGYMLKHKVQYRWLLTATPFLRNAWNIYALGRILGTTWNYFAFRREFFVEQYLGLKTIWVPKPGMQDEIAALVHQLGSTVKLEDCVDMPDAVFEIEHFKLTSAQTTAIKAVTEVLPIVRFTKHHQIAGGVLKGNEYEPAKEIKSDKVARIIELAEENAKLIISCRYLAEATMLSACLLDADPERKVYHLDGSTKDKQLVIDQFNASTSGVLIVNAACSEGWQAPSASLLVFYSLDFSYKNYVQMMGRIRRIDHPQKCTYITLICDESIDEAVLAAVERKEDFDEAIYAYKLKN